MKNKYYTFSILIALVFIFTKCANIVPITGGAQDKTEPKLKKSIPSLGTTKFKGGKILFEFDEEIEVDINPKNIITSPIINGELKLKVKNKKYLEVTIPNNLEENTTYSININNAVKDITESNIVKNINYAFSTGNALDSLSINGKTVYAENKAPIKNTLIGLYRISDTLDITKQKPLYITYTNGQGNFKLNYLKANTYYLVAIDDKNKNLSFNNAELVTNIPNLKIDSVISTPLQLELFTSDTTGNRILSKKVAQNIQTLTYKNGIKKYSYKAVGVNNEILITQNRKKATELIVYPKTYQTDSIQYIIESNDSIGNFRIDTITLQLSSKRKIKTIAGKLYLETQDILPNHKILLFSTNKPITKIKSDSIIINNNTINFDFEFNKNKDSIKISLLNNIQDTVRISFKKGSLISYDGDTLATQQFTILKADLSNYSILEMDIKTEAKNYIIQLLSEDYTVLEEYKNITNLKYPYIKPGKYRIRAIIDTNNNNYWDCGNVLKKQKSEQIIYFSKDIINLKPNWEIKDLMFIF